MHELAITKALVERVLEFAAKQGMHAVTRVELEVGQLAGVEMDALRFCFEAVTRTTEAEGAELAIEEVSGKGMCLDCGIPFHAVQPVTSCPRCDGWNVKITEGRELRLKNFTGESVSRANVASTGRQQV